MKRKLLSAAAALLLLGCSAFPSFAYFNRGDVTLTLGQKSLELEKGKSAAVSVGISPIKEQQLPGCGMAECPQTCGDTGCLNENGECTCGGLEYQTYYSSVTAVSANPSVASAEYNSGTLTVRGLAAGSTVITVRGSMRQYTDAEETLSVTVKETPAPSESGTVSGGYTAAPSTPAPTYADAGSQGSYSGNSYSGGSSGYTDSGNAWTAPSYETPVPQDSAGAVENGGVVVTPIEENPGSVIPDAMDSTVIPQEETAAGQMAEGDGSRIVNTKRGIFEMVPLTESTDVRAHMQAAMDNRRYVTFQKKNGENVVYSWTFNGEELKEAKDLNLLGTVEADIPEAMRKSAGGDRGMALLFTQSDPLPVKSDLYVGVAAVFEDGERLTARRADPSHEGEVLAEDISVENGYAAFKTDYCGPLVLVPDKGVNWIPWAVGIVAGSAAAAGAAYGLHRSRGKRGKA